MLKLEIMYAISYTFKKSLYYTYNKIGGLKYS